jgi:pimeloyl-ACP methyl ester carboxylesterase
MIPDFDSRGFLPPGVHGCSVEEFVGRFTIGKERGDFLNPLKNIINYAANLRADSILFGGSFTSEKSNPHDIDCVILFRNELQIPPVRDRLEVGSTKVDVFFASKDNPNIVASFLKLFSHNGFEERVGVVEIVLNDERGSHWDVDWYPDDDTYEIVKRVYLNRRSTEMLPKNKVLITVHGIMTHAQWNSEVTLIASTNGWVVAPFQYGFIKPTVFVSPGQRQEIVDRFRDFLTDVQRITECDSVSVLAHSLGTYVTMKYICGWDDPPIRFDTLILTGAVIARDFDFTTLNGKVAHIVNEVAPNDEWVEWAKWARDAKVRTDPLFGDAGKHGFDYAGDRLTQHRSEIFTHTNVIKRDVLSGRWMPALEANKGAANRDALAQIFRKR